MDGMSSVTGQSEAGDCGDEERPSPQIVMVLAATNYPCVLPPSLPPSLPPARKRVAGTGMMTREHKTAEQADWQAGCAVCGGVLRPR